MDIEKPTCFNYDNCIVREHSDVDSSSEASFSLGLTDLNDSAPQTSFHSSTSEDRDSNATPLKLGPYDCYVLMVGLLRRIEDYLHKSTAQDKEKHQLLEYSVRIREALMANCEHFIFSDNANQTTVASVSHNATADNDVIDNMEKSSVVTRSASSRNVKETSNPLPKTKLGKTRFSCRLQNRANLKKDSEVTVASVSVSQNGTAGNDLIDNIEETAAAATPRSSFKKAKKTSTPVPKAKVEKNRFSRRLQNLVTIKMSSDTSNNEHNIKDAISRKRCASSSNYKPAPVKRVKYVELDPRMARIKARLQQTMSSFRESSGSSESEATRESPKKTPKARTVRKNLDMVKTGGKNQVKLSGEVKPLNATRRSNRTRNKGLSISLYTVNFEKNLRQLSGEEISKPRNKSLSNSFNIAHRNNPKRAKYAKHDDKISKSQSVMGKVVDSFQQTATGNSKSTPKKLRGEGTRTRSKGLSKSLNIADKKSPKKGRGLRTSSGTSNTMVTDDAVNQNQSDDTGGTLSTSRVVMKRKLYSAETWLQTLSESMP